jgi:hypothetical protein
LIGFPCQLTGRHFVVLAVLEARNDSCDPSQTSSSSLSTL